MPAKRRALPSDDDSDDGDSSGSDYAMDIAPKPAAKRAGKKARVSADYDSDDDADSDVRAGPATKAPRSPRSSSSLSKPSGLTAREPAREPEQGLSGGAKTIHPFFQVAAKPSPPPSTLSSSLSPAVSSLLGSMKKRDTGAAASSPSKPLPPNSNNAITMDDALRPPDKTPARLSVPSSTPVAASLSTPGKKAGADRGMVAETSSLPAASAHGKPPRVTPKAAKAPATGTQDDAPALESKRLREKAFKAKIITSRESKADSVSLPPALAHCHGGSITKKAGVKKDRYLFSFPGCFSPALSSTAATIGALAQLDTCNPVMYIDFPTGQLRLNGTLVFTKAKFASLQPKKKELLCDDLFDKLVVFSEVFWIGKKEDNPDEAPLPLPEDLQKLLASTANPASSAGERRTPSVTHVGRESARMDESMADDISDESDPDTDSGHAEEEDGGGESDEDFNGGD